jgi:hypothetical protein
MQQKEKKQLDSDETKRHLFDKKILENRKNLRKLIGKERAMYVHLMNDTLDNMYVRSMSRTEEDFGSSNIFLTINLNVIDGRNLMPA